MIKGSKCCNLLPARKRNSRALTTWREAVVRQFCARLKCVDDVHVMQTSEHGAAGNVSNSLFANDRLLGRRRPWLLQLSDELLP